MVKSLLCAFECSQVLTSAWLQAGFDCWSCDLVDSFGPYPSRHIKGDAFDYIGSFDVVFAFPPCTHLTYANGAHLKEKLFDGRSFAALRVVERLLNSPNVRMVENPLGIIPKFLRNYSQIVSPDDFGSSRKKRTCLWLNNLPLLLPTSCRSGKSFIQSLSSYSFKRSVLDPFLASAMVNQWGDYV